jgi:hypothetical protein
MAGFLGGGSSGGAGGEIKFPTEFIDPVTKLRVSQPQTLIDTDFEYGLQPTKWETVELINNTPSFFSKGGDTTIPNIISVITTDTSREVKVTTQTAHGLAVGIPINVSGTKSVTADGAYIINSIPDAFTFTYLAKETQNATASIFDLYTSIITGEFFQGSQIKISDSQGIVTDAASTSVLTVQTDSPHGFQVGTPFYFLNLNSTVSQQFDASNTGAKTFDSSNSSTAQTFDGSNNLINYAVDFTNQANGNGSANASPIATANTSTNTFTVTHTVENFTTAQVGTPVYYAITATAGYFVTNPRGIAFIKAFTSRTTGVSEFSLSATPNGEVISLAGSYSGSIQLATDARLFAGNNIDTTNQIQPQIVLGPGLAFDGANNLGSVSTINSAANGSAILQMTNNAGSTIDTGLYVNAMVQYSTTSGTPITNLTQNATYWVTSVFLPAGTAASGLVQIQISATPGGSPIVMGSGYGGTHTIRKTGVSLDKDYLHVPNHSLTVGDMVKYSYPVSGAITRSNSSSDFMYVSKVSDIYNIQLKNDKGSAPDGLTAASPGVSAAQLKIDNGYNTDGVYWITINNTAQPVYCIMNSAIDGGGWMMALKATRGTTFNFNSSYWETNNLLNYTVGNTANVNRNDADAKYDVYNQFAGKDFLALWPDIGQGGSISVSGYPWIWLQNDYFGGTRITPLSFFQTSGLRSGQAMNFGGRGRYIRDAKTYSGWAAGVFSSQTDIRFYGFNYENHPNYGSQWKVRWGFGWNENSEGLYPSTSVVPIGSNDLTGGIGLDVQGQNYSAGDHIACCQDSTGINRSARVEMYVR